MKKLINFIMYPISRGIEMNKIAQENKAIEKNLKRLNSKYEIAFLALEYAA